MSIMNRDMNVKSLLDVGVGFGKFGVLAREFLDIRLKRYYKEDWVALIDGIEIFMDYTNPIYHYIYNNVFYGDALKMAPFLHNYDIIIMSEVLEHLPKEDGVELLKILYEKANIGISLSFPGIWKPSDAHSRWPNPHEGHQCLWTGEEITSMFPKVKSLSGNTYHILRPLNNLTNSEESER